MRILYRQSQNPQETVLNNFGINQCYLKQISSEKDCKNITKKEHHHTGFEIHIIKCGYHIYDINGKKCKAESGQFLLIPPLIKHRLTEASRQVSKYAITFTVDQSPACPLKLTDFNECIIKEVPLQVWNNISNIEASLKNHGAFYDAIKVNRIFEAIIGILLTCGLKETLTPEISVTEDSRLTLAKEFIADNICQNLTVADISHYCYLSEKQLTRLFLQYENTPPQKYLQQKRLKKIQKLLEDDNLTLKEISEKMNFNNEYYFSAFFKKHCGLPPNTYRKMHRR